MEAGPDSSAPPLLFVWQPKAGLQYMMYSLNNHTIKYESMSLVVGEAIAHKRILKPTVSKPRTEHASLYVMSLRMIWQALRWIESREFDCCFVILESHTGHAHSSTGRITAW